MSAAPAAIVATGFLVLSGAAAGFLLGRWSAAPPAMTPVEFTRRVPAEAPDLEPLLTEFRQGRDEILRELRERPTTPAGVPSREPAMPVVSEEQLVRLRAAMEKLNERLGADRGPGYANLGSLQDDIHIRLKRFELGIATKEELTSRLRTAHDRWTQANLLGRYGAPISLREEDGVRVVAFPLVDEGQVEFVLADDRTTEIRVVTVPR